MLNVWADKHSLPPAGVAGMSSIEDINRKGSDREQI